MKRRRVGYSLHETGTTSTYQLNQAKRKSHMSKEQEARNNTYRVRFTDSEVKAVITLKEEAGEVVDSLAIFISKTMVQLATAKGGKA
jgi:hypothetical protein